LPWCEPRIVQVRPTSRNSLLWRIGHRANTSTRMNAAPAPHVARGCLLLYRLLDIADSVDANGLAAHFDEGRSVRRVALRHDAGSAPLTARALPLEIDLGARTLTLASGTTLTGELRLRAFPFGVVSLLLEIPLDPHVALASLLPRCAEAWDAPELDALARDELDALAPTLRPFLEGPRPSPVVESYGVLFLEQLAPALLLPLDAELESLLARIVLGETDPRPLARPEIEDVLRHAWRYFDDDLALVHWNSAIVIDPGGSRDVPTILELATSQLLELRVHDERLDRELDRVYAELSRARRHGWWLFGARHVALARAVEERLLEVVELADRAGNALKMSADFFLARVYLSALRRVHVPLWRDSVDRKLVAFRDVYAVLKAEAETRRARLLEWIIALLIAFEVAWTLVHE
jgi:hypothetical protein